MNLRVREHDPSFISPFKPWRHVVELLQIYNHAAMFDELRKEVQKGCVKICWSPPPFGWTRLNTDGALKKSIDAAGCGGLLKDGSERWI